MTKRDENESDESAWNPTEKTKPLRWVDHGLKPMLEAAGILLKWGFIIFMLGYIGFGIYTVEDGAIYKGINEAIDETWREYIVKCDKLQEAMEIDSLCLESAGCSMTREELSASKERVEKWVSSCVEE